ncbi:ABC1 kinase family protein [Thermodesulfobacteriota bacterium]
MKLVHGVSRIRGMRRLGHISRILVKHGFGDFFDRLFKSKATRDATPDDISSHFKPGFPSPTRIRLVLEELGPSFIKLGQLMSTRADMFPPEYIEEFRKLQDSVPPVPFAEIEAVIEGEFGRKLAEMFKSFEPESMAAASVAQVHIAELHTGEKVAVKVIRPGIEKKIREDIQLMYYFAEKLEARFEMGRKVGFINLAREFERIIFKELDMLTEAGHMERFSSYFEKSEELYIPQVHWEYTSKSVLVMEHIDGIKMDQVDTILANDIDPKEIAMIGLRSFSRQLMDFGLFHADPHPGNTIVMYDGRVSLVDFGIMGYLDEETMLQIAGIFLGYAEHDYDMIIDAFTEAGLIDPDRIEMDAFRIDLKDMSEPFYGRSLKTVSAKDVYDQVMQLVLKHNIHLPRNYLLLLKTFIQTEALGKILDSDASLLEVTRPYAKDLLKRGYNSQKILKNIGRDTRLFGGYMRLMPKFLYDIVKTTARGKHRLEIRHTAPEGLDIKLEKGVNRITVGMVISASLIAAALVLNAAGNFLEFNITLWGQSISMTALFGITGYSMATLLGLWLVISILKSGKL